MEPVFVERLRVTASAPLESPVGLVARVEDALRTASLPAEWRGRCVLVRKVRLRAGQGWPAHRIARRLEALWRDAEARPVHATVASDASPAVWFDDETSARLALIERLARKQDVSAWFWQRLLPAGDLERQIARLANDCLRDCPSVRTDLEFAAVCRAIGEPGLIDRVIALIEPDLMYPLSPGAAFSALKFDDPHRGRAAGSAALPQGRDAEVLELARQSARIALRSASTRQDVARSGKAVAGGDSVAACGEWSDWAGIFFALNLLRLGDAPPGLDLVAGLRAIAGWLRVDPEDSVLARLDELGTHERSRLDGPALNAEAFLRSMRVACLRATRRPLRRVLRRSGRIALNRTHLTVLLRLSEVDLRVRVAGLDIDPGWVAPLARVVRFEYD